MTEGKEQYPVLALRSDILLPGTIAPVEVGRQSSLKAIDAAAKDDGLLLLVPQLNPSSKTPTADKLFQTGVLAEVAQTIKHSAKRYTVMLRCIERHTIDQFVADEPYLIAVSSPLKAVQGNLAEKETTQALAAELREALVEIISAESEEAASVLDEIKGIDAPDALTDLAAAHLDLERDLLVKLLLESRTMLRLEAVLPVIQHTHAVLAMKEKVEAEIEGEMSLSQRERVLRDRMKSIKEELGEDDSDDELEELRQRIDDSKMSEEALAASKKQLSRMRNMQASSPEYTVSRTYIETLLDIPWNEITEDTIDVSAARAILDAEHAGLEKVKKRILEFLAVRKLAPDKPSPILCLVGPPGVGKTSLGRSIANALGRKYVRAALGGVRDESEIRGHRRTYIGSLPGRIVSSLKKAGSMNPVFVLDEIDKLGRGQRGDPASALLEVLDPEQNSEFVDHYLELPVDLSKVMFWATANQLENIPGPLLDRMEVIHVPGYTVEEKLTIGRQHLLPRQISEHGITTEQISIPDETLLLLITAYTREAGVRNLEREIAGLCRNAAVKIANGAESVEILPEDLAEIVGPEVFQSEVAGRKGEPGVATGLAWTPTGGDILFLESRLMKGKGNLRLTGQLGDVMQESVTAALSWVRSNSKRFELTPEVFQTNDLHVHFPAGAIKKDGPSAGVALATALTSLFTNQPVRPDVAITGEVTLRGKVLPVGGIKEKVLAAHRAGIKIVFLPEANRKDLEDIPPSVQSELTILFAKKVDDVIPIALNADWKPEDGMPNMPFAPTTKTTPDTSSPSA